MNLKLVKMNELYKIQLNNMMKEWYETGEKIVPYAIAKADYHDFENYINSLEVTAEMNIFVPTSTFFCLDVERNILVGAVNIRHYLNQNLLLNGGHIGDGVRPSERKKGIATQMIKLALEECKKQSIINNGGILENEIVVDGIIEQRYWIEN